MTKKTPTIILLIISCVTSKVYAVNSFEYELDPYYSNAGYYISFTDSPIPDVKNESETDIYKNMFNSLTSTPRFMLIEASINPLPVAGVYLKKNHEDLYDDGQIRGDLNIIQSITEGFEEPYALSFFVGNVVQFVRPNESEKIKNKGYTGYLLSVGDKHIINNEIIDDHWYEFEVKIKGDQDFENKNLSWSLRAGTKIHENSGISDIIHFGLRRNHFDSSITNPSFTDNSDIEYTLEFDKDDFQLIQQELFITKKWHLGFTGKSAFSFGIGFIIEQGKYRGALAQEATDFRFIFRPNLSF